MPQKAAEFDDRAKATQPDRKKISTPDGQPFLPT
jgi:hypothetical protein